MRSPLTPCRHRGSGRARRPLIVLACTALLTALVAACGASEAARPDADAERGRELLREYGCAGCHEIPGVTGARGRVGPPLWAMGERAYVAGVLPNTDANLRRWIQAPQDVNPLTAMPDVGVNAADAAHMAAYLHSLHGDPVAVRMVRGFIERAMGRRTAEIAAPRREGGQ